MGARRVRNVDGETALEMAELKGHAEQVALLRRYGALPPCAPHELGAE